MLTQTPTSLVIAAIPRRIKQVIGAQVRQLGLSLARSWVCNRIFGREGMALRELEERLYLDTSTVSRAVSVTP